MSTIILKNVLKNVCFYFTFEKNTETEHFSRIYRSILFYDQKFRVSDLVDKNGIFLSLLRLGSVLLCMFVCVSSITL